MVSTVGTDQSDSTRQRSMQVEVGQTARAMSPWTDLSSSVPDTVKILLIISLSAVFLYACGINNAQAPH